MEVAELPGWSLDLINTAKVLDRFKQAAAVLNNDPRAVAVEYAKSDKCYQPDCQRNLAPMPEDGPR